MCDRFNLLCLSFITEKRCTCSTVLSDKYATVLLGLCQGSDWIYNPHVKGRQY